MQHDIAEEDGDWGRAILARWAQESDDPREDLYTLQDGVSFGASEGVCSPCESAEGRELKGIE